MGGDSAALALAQATLFAATKLSPDPAEFLALVGDVVEDSFRSEGVGRATAIARLKLDAALAAAAALLSQ